MSIFDLLSGAVDAAGQSVLADVKGIGSSVASGLAFELKTNFGPAFILGGVYHAPDAQGNVQGNANPGLLDILGIKIGGRILSADGSTLFKYGDEPATSYVYAGAAILVCVSALYLMYRGVRSFR